jgi:hypothetical protein
MGAGQLSQQQQQQQMLPAEQLSVVTHFEHLAAIRQLRRSGAAVTVRRSGAAVTTLDGACTGWMNSLNIQAAVTVGPTCWR